MGHSGSGNKDKNAWLCIDRRNYGLYLRLAYRDRGLKRKQIGALYVSPTPILDTVLASVDRLTLDELIRLRNADKSWRDLSGET